MDAHGLQDRPTKICINCCLRHQRRHWRWRSQQTHALPGRGANQPQHAWSYTACVDEHWWGVEHHWPRHPQPDGSSQQQHTTKLSAGTASSTLINVIQSSTNLLNYGWDITTSSFLLTATSQRQRRRCIRQTDDFTHLIFISLVDFFHNYYLWYYYSCLWMLCHIMIIITIIIYTCFVIKSVAYTQKFNKALSCNSWTLLFSDYVISCLERRDKNF